jgi:hypothetical protein
MSRPGQAFENPVTGERAVIVANPAVLSGRVGFLIGKEEHLLDTGAEAEVPPHTLHDWYRWATRTRA